MELLKDIAVKEQFHKLIKKFLARDENYDLNKFIGGMPITLERKDMYDLILKNSADKLKYTVTQKIDGTRVLMYICPDKPSNEKIVCFIDRNMNIYTLRDTKRDFLPNVNTRQMLLDGEIIFFDEAGVSHKELDSRYVKGISFMAFDILYGPDNIKMNTDRTKTIGQEVSMTVPSDGKLRTQPWTYINRYDILHKLIIPSQFNNNEPILPNIFKGTNWFNIELKPIYMLEQLKDKQVIYNNSNTGFLQSILKKDRMSYYNFLKDSLGKQINTFVSKPLTLDGLIFTSTDTLYTHDTWNKFMKTQYKWKPTEQQTVDLLIKKTSSDKADVFVSRNKNLIAYQVNYRPVVVDIPSGIKDNSIVEFSLNKEGKFIYKEIRSDKSYPNSIKTVLNVVNSFKNPININDLYYFININNIDKAELKKILEYSSKTKLLKCIVFNKSIDLITGEQKELILNMIKEVENKNVEVELRLGSKDRFFNTDIPKEKFNAVLEKINNFGFDREDEVFVDVYNKTTDDLPAKIRTRYLFETNLKRFILLESIIKTRRLNVDLELNSTLGSDIRFSLSDEVPIKKYATEGDSYMKKRISYTSNKLFRIDFTTIKEGVFLKDQNVFNENKDKKETNQIEIEILDKNVDIQKLIQLLHGLV